MFTSKGFYRLLIAWVLAILLSGIYSQVAVEAYFPYPTVAQATSANNKIISARTTQSGYLQAEDMFFAGLRYNKSKFPDAEKTFGTSWEVTKIRSTIPDGPEDTGLVIHTGYGLRITEDTANKSNIVQIMLTDQRHTTAKGIKVGDNTEMLLAAYGEPLRKSSKKDGTVWYSYENKEAGDRLTFIVNQNTIISIVYSVLPFGP
jgi:hypothetical protein